jgi:hypothetical protein
MKKIILLLLTCVLFYSCENDDSSSTGNEYKLQDVLKALTERNINELNYVEFNVTGSTYEHEQRIPHLSNPLKSNDYEYNFKKKINHPLLSKYYEKNDVYYPAFYQTTGGKYLVNNQNGTISKENRWRSYYMNAVTPIHMFSSELKAHLKYGFLMNPYEALKKIQTEKGLNAKIQNNQLTFVYEEGFPEMTIHFDNETKLPTKATTKELDPINGEVTLTFNYKDWEIFEDVYFPKKITAFLDDRIFLNDKISSVKFYTEFNENVFELETVSGLPLAYSDDLAELGNLYSTWYHRWNAWNIPWPEPVNDGALDLSSTNLSIFGIGSQNISPNVRIFGRPDNRLWVAGIKMSNGEVLMVDSPLNQAWTRSLINAAKEAFNVNSIDNFVLTHDGQDHFAGIREAIFESKKIYASPNVINVAKSAKTKSYSLKPDNLYTNGNTSSAEFINLNNNITYLDNGNIEIHKLLPTNSSTFPHAEGMVIIYIPSDKLIIQSDQLWSGTFMEIYNGLTYRSFTNQARLNLKNEALHLLNYINEKDLDVEKIFSAHGGLGPLSDLIQVANNN